MKTCAERRLNEDKVRKDTRAKDRLARAADDTKIYRLTLDTVDKPNLQLIMFPGKMAAANKNTVAPEAAGDEDSDPLDAATAQRSRRWIRYAMKRSTSWATWWT